MCIIFLLLLYFIKCNRMLPIDFHFPFNNT